MAAEITCADMLKFSREGTPDATVIAQVRERGVLAGDLECIQAIGLSAELQAEVEKWARVPAATTTFSPEPTRANSSSALMVELSLPDPAVAMQLSAFVGFGAGHFYACQTQTGTAHLLIQLAGAGLLGAGIVMATESPGDSTGILYIGTAVLSGGRFVDLVTAHRSAEVTRRNIVQNGEAGCRK